MLVQSQIDEYRERGFIAVPDVLPADVLEELRDEVARFVERSRQVSENDAVFDLEPSHTPEVPRLRRLKNPAQVSAVFDRVMRSDALLDLADPLLGFNGIRYRNDKLNLKIAEVGSPVEWHQDYAFYPHSNDDVLAIGVCLDDCTLENGCLRCIPGSHRLPVLDHHAGGAFAGRGQVLRRRTRPQPGRAAGAQGRQRFDPPRPHPARVRAQHFQYSTAPLADRVDRRRRLAPDGNARHLQVQELVAQGRGAADDALLRPRGPDTSAPARHGGVDLRGPAPSERNRLSLGDGATAGVGPKSRKPNQAGSSPRPIASWRPCAVPARSSEPPSRKSRPPSAPESPAWNSIRS